MFFVGTCGQAVHFIGRQGLLQHARNGRGDLALDTEQVAHRTIVALGPEVLVRGHVDELRGDAQLITSTLHTAFEDGADVQLRTDLLDGKRITLVLHAGGARDHVQVLDLGELRDDVLRKSIAEELLVGIAAHVHEGQHGHGEGTLVRRFGHQRVQLRPSSA